MPQGIMRGDDTDLQDTSYDGLQENGVLRDGLGQLVDGLYGEDDFEAHVNGENSGKFAVLKDFLFRLKLHLCGPQGNFTT